MSSKPAQKRPNARKTPKQARSLETVKVIVEAAARILEADGLEGFSTNAVAERAGVSIGSLYQYFPSKDALIGALIVRETSLLIEEAQAASRKRTGASALSALILAAIAHQFRRPLLARVLDFEEARLPFDADTQRVADEFRTMVMDALSRPDIPAQTNSAIAAQDTMAIIKGIIDTAGVNKEIDNADLANRVERAVFGYLNSSMTNRGRER